jgi:hypothetical protein
LIFANYQAFLIRSWRRLLPSRGSAEADVRPKPIARPTFGFGRAPLTSIQPSHTGSHL